MVTLNIGANLYLQSAVTYKKSMSHTLLIIHFVLHQNNASMHDEICNTNMDHDHLYHKYSYSAYMIKIVDCEQCE